MKPATSIQLHIVLISKLEKFCASFPLFHLSHQMRIALSTSSCANEIRCWPHISPPPAFCSNLSAFCFVSFCPSSHGSCNVCVWVWAGSDTHQGIRRKAGSDSVREKYQSCYWVSLTWPSALRDAFSAQCRVHGSCSADGSSAMYPCQLKLCFHCSHQNILKHECKVEYNAT